MGLVMRDEIACGDDEGWTGRLLSAVRRHRMSVLLGFKAEERIHNTSSYGIQNAPSLHSIISMCILREALTR
jgi:hypothetical protein